jgi:hypothetical protein
LLNFSSSSILVRYPISTPTSIDYHRPQYLNSTRFWTGNLPKTSIMADAPEVISGEDKNEFRSSSTEVSKTKYSLDGVVEANADDDIYSRVNPPRPGFTKSDQKDMYRMGKIQEFRVSQPSAAIQGHS